MVAASKVRRSDTGKTAASGRPRLSRSPSSAAEAGFAAAVALREAEQAGLLAGERTEHLSFRAPKALVEAARREAGVTSTTELGLAALALLAQPDPVAEYLARTKGRLGADHRLEH